MRLYPEQLAEHLKGGLKPCYLVFGDEPLLKLEALTQIRRQAQSEGFDERHLFSSDEPLDWNRLFDACHALSLFSARQIIELEVGTKLPKEWPERIRDLQQLLHPDLLLLLHGPRLTLAQTKAKWFDNLSRLGVHVPVAPPDSRHFPRWMQQRFAQAGLQAEPDAIRFMCHAFEGNLLAVSQEIEKLGLLGLPQPLGLEQLKACITQHNHFTPFQLIDTLLAGKLNRAQRILFQLRDEGVEAGMLSWALARELDLLTGLRLGLDRGETVGTLLEQAKVWSNRRPLFQQALQRLSSRRLRRLLAMAVALDEAVRRFDQEQAWLLLQTLCAGFGDTEPPLLMGSAAGIWSQADRY